MTIGVGGSSAEAELALLSPMRGAAPPIGDAERAARIRAGARAWRGAGSASPIGGAAPRMGERTASSASADEPPTPI
ncbi:MAG: hypothetical protein ACKOGH_17475, partial [Alphaproteobacteria bacterium]